jgi:hypothetical protein
VLERFRVTQHIWTCWHLHEKSLVDILPVDVVPTWRNGRNGREEISKILDQVYISKDLISTIGRYRSWVAYPFVSDHALVLLQLENNSNSTAHPFKLNLLWLRDDVFSMIVQDVWNDHIFCRNLGLKGD